VVSDLLLLSLALGLDLLVGEPPNAIHPVAWMGQYFALGERWAYRGNRWHELLWGTSWVVGGAFVLLILFPPLLNGLEQWSPLLALLASVYLLKSTFAIRGLFRTARLVQGALERGDVEEARGMVSRHLVSRETKDLNPSQVAAATVESVAENFTDGVVAPLAFFLLLGLPGALTYRFINTADAMWGYRDLSHEHLGKTAARLDDLVNWLPARLAAQILIVAAWLTGGDRTGAWKMMWRDHQKTQSPNAGWTMAAMAGALGVSLEKAGLYCLGEGRSPNPADISRALRHFGVSVFLWTGLCLGFLGVRGG
jgi:adenosylcobinamide-phosphate synthase